MSHDAAVWLHFGSAVVGAYLGWHFAPVGHELLFGFIGLTVGPIVLTIIEIKGGRPW